MFSLKMTWNRNQKCIIVKNILRDPCKLDLRSSSGFGEFYQLRLELKWWSETIKNNWCLSSTLAICFPFAVYSSFLLIASLVVTSTVHRLLLRQLGVWVASDRWLARSEINFLNTLRKGWVVLFWVGWLVFFVGLFGFFF